MTTGCRCLLLVIPGIVTVSMKTKRKIGPVPRPLIAIDRGKSGPTLEHNSSVCVNLSLIFGGKCARIIRLKCFYLLDLLLIEKFLKRKASLVTILLGKKISVKTAVICFILKFKFVITSKTDLKII